VIFAKCRLGDKNIILIHNGMEKFRSKAGHSLFFHTLFVFCAKTAIAIHTETFNNEAVLSSVAKPDNFPE